MVLHRSEVMVLMRHAFFYLRHLSVGTDMSAQGVSPLIRNTSLLSVCAFFDLELDYYES